MYKIFYSTRKSNVCVTVQSLKSLRIKIKNLWQARIPARAEDEEKNEVAWVYKHDETGLVWQCI